MKTRDGALLTPDDVLEALRKLDTDKVLNGELEIVVRSGYPNVELSWIDPANAISKRITAVDCQEDSGHWYLEIDAWKDGQDAGRAVRFWTHREVTNDPEIFESDLQMAYDLAQAVKHKDLKSMATYGQRPQGGPLPSP